MPRFHFCIVVPSYNQAQFISHTLSSLVSQKGDFSLSVLVRDGKSTDGTLEILKSYGSSIEWVSQPDDGQTDAINQGIAYFQQQSKKLRKRNLIFAYLNSDDYYLPDALANVCQAFTNHPHQQWLVGDAVIVDESGQEIHKSIRFYKQLWRALLSWRTLLVLNPIPQPATFIRWTAVEKTGPFNVNLQYVMDYQYWLRLYQVCGRPLLLQQSLAAFRIHTQSKGGSQFIKQFTEEFHIAQKYTSNPILLTLHRLHSFLIVTAYKWLKSTE
ncbi:MAG TPA: glycosyltransferase family 2 protein [Patescibacteria group bacterium]